MITAAAAAKAYHVEGVFFLLHAPGVLQRRPAIRPRDLLRLCHVGEFIRQDTRRPGAAPAQRPTCFCQGHQKQMPYQRGMKCGQLIHVTCVSPARMAGFFAQVRGKRTEKLERRLHALPLCGPQP